MEVILAKTAGFCFGVKRAVDMVYNQIGAENTYTFGPIIHNEEVVEDLKSKGIGVIHSMEEAKSRKPGTIIMRSHGAARKVYEELESLGWNIIDATCPFVKKIHRIVEKESQNGAQIVIIGNENHPEVEGIMGWCESRPVVIDTTEKAFDFECENNKKVCIVSQTTFNYKKFQELVEIIAEKGYDIDVRNTICNATEERQTEARMLAQKADAMIVIGGKNSSNTQKLFEICKDECENTYYIQTLRDLDLNKFSCAGCVGITAGASTPNNIIQEVHTNVRI
ncbi:MAG: 4-hydroxy-3-methylbut-2-enyl diphosphate reductase [Thermoflexaceae bacterium]|nr:4-hydroxy-3-methylbut-2-enyl diphosphate reductase [Thermoflexaceae bacterium]